MLWLYITQHMKLKLHVLFGLFLMQVGRVNFSVVYHNDGLMYIKRQHFINPKEYSFSISELERQGKCVLGIVNMI